MSTYSVIGQRVHRIDGPEKVTGSAKYTFDMVLPNMLYGKILRSPAPGSRPCCSRSAHRARCSGCPARRSSRCWLHNPTR